ncbi:MAG TPA: hypothetical protein VGF24_37450 [Vicinamibacterales bacterium]
MIHLLIPVLGRPQNAQRLADSIDAATIEPHLTIFLATRYDRPEIEACKATGKPVFLVDPGPCEYARKINHGTGCALGVPDFFFLGADDLRFHPGWDTAALRVWEQTGKGVIGTNDLGNATVMRGDHATHSLVHITYLEQGTIDEPGKLLHEGYDHNYVDTEFIGTAMSRGEWAFAADSHVEHLHPFWQKGPDDLIYKKGRKTVNKDHRTYNQRQRLWS